MRTPEYKWDSRHAIVLDSYIQKLSKSGIKYFILRNYEGLPEINESKDIDLIIEPGKYTIAAELLYDTYKEHNIEYYYVVKYERVRCWFGMNASDDFSIHIDLIEGYVNKGFEIFEFDLLYENTEFYKKYRVLNQSYDTVTLLLYKVIGAKQLKQRYRDKISCGYHENRNIIQDILTNVLGRQLATQVCDRLNSQDYEWIIKHAGDISKKSKIIAFRKNPVKTSFCIGSFLLEKIYRIGLCPQKYRKTIALEAPDGAGKSTFIDEMAIMLAETFVCDIEKMHIYHFRPSILPNLGAVGEKAGVMKQDKDFENPHRNKSANPVSSFVRMVYYWLDYVFGGAICVRRDVQFDKITIFDRYIYDFIIDPLRSRINLPKFVRVAFAKLVQQPKIVFVLRAPADVIYSRKQELSQEEIERQLIEFENLKKIGRNFVTINANQTPGEMVLDAKKVILEKFCSKIG